MKKMLVYITVVALLLPIFGFGCNSLSAAQQTAIQPITLNFWTVYDDIGTLRKFADNYKVVRPYVTINIRQVRYEEFDNLFVNALADDVAPDIISVHTRWLKKYQSRLAEMPASVKVSSITQTGTYQKTTVVTPEVNAMPTIYNLQKNYVATVVDDVTLGGKIYGLPLAVDSLAIFYNKDILDKAGIAVPPTTWDEFNAAVKKTTKFDRDGNIVQSGVAMGTGNNIDNAVDIFALLLMQQGVPIVTGGRVAFADGLDRQGVETHPTLEALRFYTDFARPTRDVYSWNEKMGNALEQFAHGQAAFYLGFSYDRVKILARGPQLTYDVVPVPQLNTPVNVANYWVEAVVKKSKKQNEAWDFIRFMSLSSNIKKYTEATGSPSPLRSQVAVQANDPRFAPFATQVLTAKNWYRGRDIDAASAALKNIFKQTLLPVGATEDPLKRDVQSIIFAAQVMQQTL